MRLFFLAAILSLGTGLLPGARVFAADDEKAETPEKPAAAEITEPVSMQRPNAVSFEGLGRGIFYSVDYDRSIFPWWGVGAGLSYFNLSLDFFGPLNVSAFVMPVYMNFYILPHRHRPFGTVGTALTLTTGSSSAFSASGSFGGGYEFRGLNGFLFRVAAYGIFSAVGISPWFGVSFGYAF